MVPGVVAGAVRDLEDDGGHQDDEDQNGGHEPPGDLPVDAQLHTGHVFDVLKHLKMSFCELWFCLLAPIYHVRAALCCFKQGSAVEQHCRIISVLHTCTEHQRALNPRLLHLQLQKTP